MITCPGQDRHQVEGHAEANKSLIGESTFTRVFLGCPGVSTCDINSITPAKTKPSNNRRMATPAPSSSSLFCLSQDL